MTKATHQGTCQCCGRMQKLPNGKLSKHGYTVDHGWFQGVCLGAGELPFEQSTDLIQSLIEATENHITETQKKIEEIRTSEDSKNVWNHAYRSHRECGYGQRSGYYWEQRELIIEPSHSEEYDNASWIYSEGEAKPTGFLATQADFFRKGEKTLTEIVKEQNEKYIQRVLLPEIKQAEGYITWQEERIKNWKPAELTPIK